MNTLFFIVKDVVRMVDNFFSILQFYWNREAFNDYLRRWHIATVGKNTWITPNVRFDLFKPKSLRDKKEPIIEIGNHCIITEYTQFIGHDTSSQFLFAIRNKAGIKKWGKIRVGDRVFIGTSCIIMPGVTIHDDVLVGAGSVVTKDLESNGVYFGNPAKRYMDLEKYMKRMIDREANKNKTK